jgi:hypothetical protein
MVATLIIIINNYAKLNIPMNEVFSVVECGYINGITVASLCVSMITAHV